MHHPHETAVGRNSGGLTGGDETFGFVADHRTAAAVLGGRLAAGTDLGGVTILRLLGSGGMGQVYQARQHAPPRQVAVKVVRRAAADLLSHRLEDEAALLGQLDHPHIARVYTVGRRTVAGNDCPWLMMELVEGARSVSGWASDGSRRLAERVALVQDAATALAAAHAKGVLHLDVKPSNILVDRQGVLKLIDFGIGRRFDHDRRGQARADGRIVGTPGAMSPEQLAGRDDLLDARSDIYSLGLVLFELVVGRPPTGRPETPAAAEALLAGAGAGRLLGPAVVAAARAAGCSRFAAADLGAIASRCLAVNPAERFATAWELAEELDRWQSGRLLRCRRPGRVERVCRWAGRYPTVGVMSALMVTLAVAAFILISRYAVENRRERTRAEQAADAARLSLASALLRQAVAAGAHREPDTVNRLLAARQATLAALVRPLARGEVPAADGLATRCLRSGLDEAVDCWANPQGQVTAVAVAAGGTQAVAGDVAGGVAWFSLRDAGLELRTAASLAGGRVWAAAIARDGERAAVAGDAGTIMLLEPGQPGLPEKIPEEIEAAAGTIYGLAFLPRGDQLISGGRDGVVRLWDLGQRELLRSYGPVGTSVYGVAVSPAGTTVAAAVRDGSVQLWDIATAKPAGQLLGHQGRVFSVAFSPDGHLLASASEDQTVRLWDLASLSERRRLDHPARINAVQFVGNDRLVTAGGDRLLRCWRVTGQRPPRELSGHAGGIWAVAVADREDAILTASADGTVRRWNGTGDPQPRLSLDEAVKCLALAPDGRRAAMGTVEGVVSIWEPSTGRLLARTDPAAGPINGLCWLPGSAQVLVTAGDGFVGCYRLLADDAADETGDCQLERVSRLQGHRRRVFAGAATADAATIATAGEDKTVRLWTARGEPAGLLKHPGRVFSVAFAPAGGGQLATGCEDGLVRIFTSEGQECFRARGHRGQVNSVCWNPRPAGGWAVASAGADGQVQLWQLPGPEPLEPDRQGPRRLQLVRTLAGANAKLWQIVACRQEPLLAGATDAGEVILWDTHEPSPLELLRGHRDAAWAIALGPGERWLVSGGWDRTVRFWGISAREWNSKGKGASHQK